MCKIAETREEVNENSVFISKHARERMKERMGWNQKAQNRMVVKIWDNGKRTSSMNNGSLKRYLSEKEVNHCECVTYGDNLFLFDSHVLITAYHLHKSAYIRKNQNTKKEKRIIRRNDYTREFECPA